MGHLIGKDISRKVGATIDSMPTRAPYNEALHAVLRELFSADEADLFVRLPYSLSTLKRISQVTRYDQGSLRKTLDRLCSKGLAMDFWLHGEYHYMPSPLIIGIYEFTMMRTGDNLNTKEWARLFHRYFHGDDSFWDANCKKGDKIPLLRTIPYEDSIRNSDHVEILDYEKARSLIERADKFAVGLCSCRHEKMHRGDKACDVPLETCSSFGMAADFLIRRDMAKEVSRSRMLENLARSKELGLVLNADNVKRSISYLCHCCKCCCKPLLGIRVHGYPNALVTSNFMAENHEDQCMGCGKCSRACPIDGIKMVPLEHGNSKKKKRPLIDRSVCLGCGVCVLQCESNGVELVYRGKRVITPETTFGRVILQSLEKGTLQNQLFDNPGSRSQAVMRGILGAFLRLPPIKKALMSDILRSSFLKFMESGISMQGKGWMSQI